MKDKCRYIFDRVYYSFKKDGKVTIVLEGAYIEDLGEISYEKDL